MAMGAFVMDIDTCNGYGYMCDEYRYMFDGYGHV